MIRCLCLDLGEADIEASSPEDFTFALFAESRITRRSTGTDLTRLPDGDRKVARGSIRCPLPDDAGVVYQCS
jgi:hypothetical protein